MTNPGGSGGALTAAFTYSFEEPVTVTPSTNVVDAGGQMSVSWTAPGARAGDWIALFRVGGSYDDDWWGDTNGATSGTLTVIAPTRPGQYEFRYLLGRRFSRRGAQQRNHGTVSPFRSRRRLSCDSTAQVVVLWRQP